MSSRQWPAGTGQWKRIRTLVVSEDARDRERLDDMQDAVLVATPLDMITLLEDDRILVDTVVLAGGFAGDHEIAAVLHELYPGVGLREDHSRRCIEEALPS